MAKVKVNVDLKAAKKKFSSFQNRALGVLKNKYPDIIKRDIERGISPVKGKRFQKYSTSYKEAISDGRYSQFGKSKSPVNMKLTGEMLNSLSARRARNSIRISFDNFLADIHNRLGAGKSKVVRRLLPTKQGEEFNLSIQRDVRELLRRIAKNIFR